MSIRKHFIKTKSVCKVIFLMPKERAISAKDVFLVGDFNNWDTSATPMKKTKDGTFSVTLNLEQGREYQYRYLIDGVQWENDSYADKYVPSPYGDSENSVVVL